MAALAAVVVFPAAMICAGIMDLTTMKIRNWLLGFLIAFYAILAPLAGFGLREIGLSLLIGASVLLVAFTLFHLGWIGGGDAKLAAVSALWLGAVNTLDYVVYTALLGGVLAASMLLFRTFSIPVSWQRQPWVNRLHTDGAGIPYGVALAGAALIVFTYSPWTANLL